MSFLRIVPSLTALACLVLAAASSAAQDPGQGGSPPPHIQGPSGGPLAAPPGTASNGAGPEPLKFNMFALLGQKKSGTAATLDEAMKPIEGALKGLPYTDYEKITVDARETPEGVDTQFPINPIYTLVVRPNGKDAQGAAKLDIHVDLLQDGKLIKALTAQAAAKPGDALLLRGMPLPPGELVIVLQRDAGDQKSQSEQSNQEQQNQDQQNQQQQQSDQDKDSKKDDSEKKLDQSKKDEKKEDEKKDKKEGKDEKKEDKDQDKKDQAQEQPSSEDAKKEAAEKKDTKNLESLLQSLEDVDRKEQAEVRNKRDRIDFKGDWW